MPGCACATGVVHYPGPAAHADRGTATEYGGTRISTSDSTQPRGGRHGGVPADMTSEEEFTEFAAAASPRLRRTAFLLCGDWQAAEDLT